MAKHINIFQDIEIPQNTILLADEQASDAIALSGGIMKYVPSLFLLICTLGDPEKVKSLIERLMSTIDFEHIALFITRPISNYDNQIQILDNFGFDIHIIGTTPDIEYTIPQVSIQIDDLFEILPIFPKTLPIQLGLRTDIPDQVITDNLLSILDNSVTSFFSYGPYSNKIRSLLESGWNTKHSEVSTAVFLIDRSEIITPLFVHQGSYLDKSSSHSTVSTLIDSTFISTELNYGEQELLNQISEFFQLTSTHKTYNSLLKHWKSLTPNEQFELTKAHPSLPHIFNDSSDDIELEQLESSILQGADFEDLISTVSYDLRKSLPLIGFLHCFGGFDINSEVLTAFRNCNSGMSDMRNEDEIQSIFENCKSNCNLNQKKENNLEDLFYLPKLLKGIIFNDVKLEDGIQPAEGLFSKFFSSKKKTLKDFSGVYVIVLGGISFYELKLIKKMIKNSEKSVNLKIFSESICSSENILMKNK